MHNVCVVIRTVALLIATLGGAFAQGTVNFWNTGAYVTQADRLVRDSTGNLLVGTNYLVQLYYGDPGSLEAQLVSVDSAPRTFRQLTTSSPGTWIGATRTLNGFTAGQEVSLQVRVWDVATGSTWEQAMIAGFANTQYGASPVFSYFVPLASASPTYGQMDNFRSFSLVPEPSVAILGALGLLGAWLWKRALGTIAMWLYRCRIRERINSQV
jgi:hypothetical protein